MEFCKPARHLVDRKSCSLSFFFQGLEKNETRPTPTLSKPRTPNEEERKESVQITIENMKKSDVSYFCFFPLTLRPQF